MIEESKHKHIYWIGISIFSENEWDGKGGVVLGT